MAKQKVFVRIKRQEGFFEDVTQPDAINGAGTLSNGEIKEMERTPRLQTFLQNGGLEELGKDSDEVKEHLKQKAEDAKKPKAAKKETPASPTMKALTEAVKEGFKAAAREVREEDAELEDDDEETEGSGKGKGGAAGRKSAAAKAGAEGADDTGKGKGAAGGGETGTEGGK